MHKQMKMVYNLLAWATIGSGTCALGKKLQESEREQWRCQSVAENKNVVFIFKNIAHDMLYKY